MKNLLLVDSDMTVQQWAESNLSSEGFEVTSYGDGLSALDMLSKVDPDVVLAEYRLAGMNIFRFCEKLRQKDAGKKRALFILCNPEDSADRGRLASAGVDGIINKPMMLAEVLGAIRSPGGKPAAPAEKAPEAAPAFSPQEDTEGPRMEELLGWTKAEEATAAPAPAGGGAPAAPGGMIPGEDDRTVVAGAARSDDEATVMFGEVSGKSAPEVNPRDAGNLLISGSMAELAQVSVPPGGTSGSQESRPAPAEVPAGDIEAAVSKAAREIIEKVAWEVVPTIAEALIREELEKLKSETPD